MNTVSGKRLRGSKNLTKLVTHLGEIGTRIYGVARCPLNGAPTRSVPSGEQRGGSCRKMVGWLSRGDVSAVDSRT
jgi:hypothetical protein